MLQFCRTVTGRVVYNSIVFILVLGLFHIIRLPRLNSLVSHVPDSFDLAFKLRRKKMSIEVKLGFFILQSFVAFIILAA